MPTDDFRLGANGLKLDALQREIDQSHVAEAMVCLDLAHLDLCRLRLDEAEAHISEANAIMALAGLENDETTKRVEYLRGQIVELREVIRR